MNKKPAGYISNKTLKFNYYKESIRDKKAKVSKFNVMDKGKL